MWDKRERIRLRKLWGEYGEMIEKILSSVLREAGDRVRTYPTEWETITNAVEYDAVKKAVLRIKRAMSEVGPE